MNPPELTQEFCDSLTKTAQTQLTTSRTYKRDRLAKIAENENLYLGVIQKTLVDDEYNEFTVPFMSGFVDHYTSRVDKSAEMEIRHRKETDYRLGKKYTALFEKESSSPEVWAKWAYKDRAGRKYATIGGRAIYGLFPQSEPNFHTVLEAVDYYDFHCEPGGGGLLENHQFCGQEGVFLTKQELLEGAQSGLYDERQVGKLITGTSQNDYKDNEDELNMRQNRQRALELDPVTNNYVGQPVFKFVKWFLSYQGFRWYNLFEPRTGTWIRVKLLKELFNKNRWPYVSWATHEDASTFWSKAPADDARSIAKAFNRMIRQELYNRDKLNQGQRAFDPEMFEDLEALSAWRADGLVPFNSKGGSRRVQDGLFEFRVAGLGGTLDLMAFVESFTGKMIGNTPGSQGQAPKDQKVGIYFGEIDQVDRFIGMRNDSYREAQQELAMRFVDGVNEYMSEPEAIELMGAKGVEWDEIRPDETKPSDDFKYIIKGGAEEDRRNAIRSEKRANALAQVKSVNPRWRDEELLREGGYDEAEIKRAFDLNAADQQILSEAAQAEEDIVKGRMPKLNPRATAAYMQHILDFAGSTEMDDQTFDRLIEFATQHAEIASKNEARNAAALIASFNTMATGMPVSAGADPLSKGGVASTSQNLTSNVSP